MCLRYKIWAVKLVPQAQLFIIFSMGIWYEISATFATLNVGYDGFTSTWIYDFAKKAWLFLLAILKWTYSRYASFFQDSEVVTYEKLFVMVIGAGRSTDKCRRIRDYERHDHSTWKSSSICNAKWCVNRLNSISSPRFHCLSCLTERWRELLLENWSL